MSSAPTSRPATGPLAGVTVLEIGGIGPGAFAGLLLADLGAEVIRIDRQGWKGNDFLPAHLDVLNRGKRSIALDLKSPEGVGAVLALAEQADIVVEGFRPGVTDRLGIGPDAMLARNPTLVYGRMTGWGQDGPLAQTAGHDVGYIAITGSLHAIGNAGGPPVIPLTVLGDFCGGAAYLVMGLLSAHIEAQRTGVGQVVDGAIIDGATHLMSAVHALLAAGAWVDERGVNQFDGGCPFYSTYETSDGKYMAVGALEPQFYAEFIRLLGVDEDPARQNDTSRWPQLREALAAAFRSRTRDEWSAVFEGTDACTAPVMSVVEAKDHPHMAARQVLIEIDGVMQAAPAPRFSAYPAPRPAAPPQPGVDTREILARVGLEGLIEAGVATQA